MSEKELITEFLLAAEQGNAQGLTSCLAKNVDINATNRRGRTAIIIASLNKHYDCVSLLIEAGADINKQDQTCFNPFLISCLTNDLTLLRLVLPANPDLNVLSRFGGVGITPASEKGHVEIVRELLLRTDINVNHTNFVGWTPLLEAIVTQRRRRKAAGNRQAAARQWCESAHDGQVRQNPAGTGAGERVSPNCRAADCRRSLTEERHYRHAITAMRNGANRRRRVS